MEQLIMTLGWMGMFAPCALGAIGSIMGCTKAGQAACGAILETEGGHGKFIGISAMPSSQVIFGIVLTLALRRGVTAETVPGLFGIGVLAGVALLLSSFYQGDCIASAINASKSKPEIFGLSVAPAAIVEGFAVFAFVFALVLTGGIPK